MLLTTNEEALLAVSTCRGRHSSLWQHQLNPPGSHQEEIGIQRREQVKAADWFNTPFLHFVSWRKGNQFCASHGDGKGNTEHLHDSEGRVSTSALGCVRMCTMERHFLQQGGKPLNTQFSPKVKRWEFA